METWASTGRRSRPYDAILVEDSCDSVAHSNLRKYKKPLFISFHTNSGKILLSIIKQIDQVKSQKAKSDQQQIKLGADIQM